MCVYVKMSLFYLYIGCILTAQSGQPLIQDTQSPFRLGFFVFLVKSVAFACYISTCQLFVASIITNYCNNNEKVLFRIILYTSNFERNANYKYLSYTCQPSSLHYRHLFLYQSTGRQPVPGCTENCG